MTRFISLLVACAIALLGAAPSDAVTGPRRVLLMGKGSGGSGPAVQPLRSAVSRAMVAQQFVGGLSATFVQGQSREQMYLGDAPSTELHVCVGNWANQGEQSGPGNLIWELAIELDGPVGVARATFSGQNTLTQSAGATNCSDAVLPSAFGLTVFPANAAIWFRTGCTAVSNLGFPTSNVLSASGEGMWAAPAFTSQVNATGAMTTPASGAAVSGMCQPFAVTARYTVPMPSVCDIGDSISAGINDSNLVQSQGELGGNGYVGRAAYQAGNSGGNGTNIYPTFKLGIGGDSATPGGYTQRATFFQYCDRAVFGWGVNDINGGATAAAVFANDVTAWATAKTAGVNLIYQALVTPKTTTTDNWLTEANQTYFSAVFQPGGTKDQLNTLITASIGSNNLTGTVAVSTTVSGVDPDKWSASIITPLTTYTPNVTVTSGTKAFSFSAGTFAAADVGKTISIAGAGAAGALYVDTIASVVSTTSITTTTNNAGTGLVAAAEAVNYGFPATVDGLHPLGYAHGVIAPVYAAKVYASGQQLPSQNNSWVPTGADWAMDFQNGRYYGIRCQDWFCVPWLSATDLGLNRSVAAYGVTANNSTGTLIQFGPLTSRITPGRGLLLEKITTNLFASPFSPATQTATVANSTQYTASVVGTGSMTLSGACTGTVTAGSPVTCTSSTTSLTATVTGTLLAMQVETGAVATSPINGSRTFEDLGFPSALLNNVTYPTGTFLMSIEGVPNGPPFLAAFGSDYLISVNTTSFETTRTATLVATLGAAANNHTLVGFAWDGTGRGLDGNGGTIATDANGTTIVNNTTQLYLGGQGNGAGDSTLNSYIQRIVHFPTRLTGATTPTFQQATTP